jgi:hypothetical protein
VNFVKDCLLHCLFGVDVLHPSSAVFDLHRPHTLTADVLPESIIEAAPESFVLFSFNNGKDIAFGGFVVSVLCRVEAIFQMLPPVALSVLSKVITLLLTDRHAKSDVVDSELKWSIDLASPCGAAQIAIVP